MYVYIHTYIHTHKYTYHLYTYIYIYKWLYIYILDNTVYTYILYYLHKWLKHIRVSISLYHRGNSTGCTSHISLGQENWPSESACSTSTSASPGAQNLQSSWGEIQQILFCLVNRRLVGGFKWVLYACFFLYGFITNFVQQILQDGSIIILIVGGFKSWWLILVNG